MCLSVETSFPLSFVCVCFIKKKKNILNQNGHLGNKEQKQGFWLNLKKGLFLCLFVYLARITRLW